MDQERRLILFLIIATVIILMFSQKMQSPKQKKPVSTQSQQTADQSKQGETGRTEIPDLTVKGTTSTLAISDSSKDKSEVDGSVPGSEKGQTDKRLPLPAPINIETKVFKIDLSPIGGRIQRWEITDPHYAQFSEDSTTKTLDLIPVFPRTVESELPLEIELKEASGTYYDAINSMLFESKVEQGKNGETIVTFISPRYEGIIFKKTYTFYPQSYVADCSIEIQNTTDARYRFNDEGLGLQVSWGPGVHHNRRLAGGSYFYSVQSTSAIHSNKSKAKPSTPTIKDQVESTGETRWGGIQSKYFLCAIVSPNNNATRFKAFIRSKNVFPEYERFPKEFYPPITVKLGYKEFELNPGERRTFDFRIFGGPKERKILKTANYDFDKALFATSWGFIRPVELLLLDALNWIFAVFRNYGLAIIILTLLVKLILYPINNKAIKMQAKFTAQQAFLKPQIEEINKKFKNDSQARGKAMMELYKKFGINPFASLQGCLPMLLMMPIFIALYWLFSESIELRNQGFLWIKDLSQQDKLFKFGTSIPILGEYFNLLPILMGASQLVISLLSSSTTAMSQDNFQKQFMIIFPLFFTVLLYSLPSGLILYWTVSNVFQIFHQLITNKIIKSELAKHKLKYQEQTT